MIRVLSLGAGVQSSTLALMLAERELEPVDFAIFADTGAEPQAVYDWIDWLLPRLPCPTLITHADLLAETYSSTNHTPGAFNRMPVFTLNRDYSVGRSMRECTTNYKVRPIQQVLRQCLGYRPHQRIPANSVEMLIGISTDEIRRAKQSRAGWISHRWPLIEMKMSRGDCIAWCKRHGYPQPPRSSCVCCPHHTDYEWAQLSGVDLDCAVSVDEAIRHGCTGLTKNEGLYLHRSARPLREVRFDLSQKALVQPDMLDECAGLCGV